MEVDYSHIEFFYKEMRIIEIELLFFNAKNRAKTIAGKKDDKREYGNHKASLPINESKDAKGAKHNNYGNDKEKYCFRAFP